MNSIKFQMTAMNPSRCGMPMSDRAFDMTTPVTAARTATAAAVRDRAAIAATAGAVQGHVGLADCAFPGTSAWRPPTC